MDVPIILSSMLKMVFDQAPVVRVGDFFHEPGVGHKIFDSIPREALAGWRDVDKFVIRTDPSLPIVREIRHRPEFLFALPQGRLHPLAFGDVGEHGEGALESAGFIHDGLNCDDSPQFRAVPAAESPFIVITQTLPALGLANLVIGKLVWEHVIRRRPTEHFFRGVAQHVCHVLIDIGSVKVSINSPDAFIGGFDNLAGYLASLSLRAPSICLRSVMSLTKLKNLTFLGGPMAVALISTGILRPVLPIYVSSR